MKQGFLERSGQEIVAVNVADNIQLPLEHLMLPIRKNGELYWRHPVGGGLVADSAYIPDDLRVGFDVRIANNTRLLSDRGIFGQSVIRGNFSNPEEVSRWMDEDDLELRRLQKENGMVSRLLTIERRLVRAADIADVLF